MGFPSLATTFVSTLVALNTMLPLAQAADPATIQGTNAAGITSNLLVDRTPALYTKDFGDCMGGQSLVNLTSFDAAYYADNMTVLFNMAGTTNLKNEAVMCKLLHSKDWWGVEFVVQFERVLQGDHLQIYTRRVP